MCAAFQLCSATWLYCSNLTTISKPLLFLGSNKTEPHLVQNHTVSWFCPLGTPVTIKVLADSKFQSLNVLC